ncbi:hypothetical protein ACIBU0_03150 [Streptomyces sp. NPDC049627]|uniref:hypothetical protein n=1 Tax=Streptomyces sp. NPDC049627 TaxID=3365595 RepID=UPI00378E93D9
MLAADTVVSTGDFVPETELVRPGTLIRDTGVMRTSRPGVFAAGGVLHPGEGAATAAREGVQAAAAVGRWLGDAVPSA